MKSAHKALLLVNLGTPLSPAVSHVRKYLKEFLMDPRVLDLPYWKRWLIVHLFVLPFRPKRSAEAYQKIWTSEGSPILYYTERVVRWLDQELSLPVFMAMRYGEPSIKKIITRIHDQGIQEIHLLPLYPHYAMSTTETVMEETKKWVNYFNLSLKILPPFYKESFYIDALIDRARPFLEKSYDHLLFSFHGVPLRHLIRTDPTKSHCLKVENCCFQTSPAHSFCYRYQVFQTMEEFAKRADLKRGTYSLTFQSRFGRDVWTQPFADEVIPQLAEKGVKKLLVICPGFVADCLETLEEIGLRGKESFLKAGGKEFHLIPCLNDHPKWLAGLKSWILENVN
ncbi:MAG: ferrochelatase [Planctomycetota bacterium]|nr:MAG: ferrochelatase [Planctomycetota bacterium]